MANPRPRGCCIRAAEVREGSATHRRRLQKIRSKQVGCNTTAPRPRGRCITAAVVREGSGGRERPWRWSSASGPAWSRENLTEDKTEMIITENKKEIK